ncbi:hypothetical protein [Bacillus mojavensis]
MGYFVTSVIIGVLIGFSIGISERDVPLGIQAGFAGCFIGAVVSGVLFMVFDSVVERETYVVRNESIVALQDNMANKGSYVLGTGSTDEGLKYNFMAKKEKGLKADSIDADEVFLVEDDKTNPHIITKAKRAKRDVFREWFPVMDHDKENILYIPKKSIQYDYNVDLK